MERRQEPLVSVISLCYNHANFLKQALDSVKNQTYKNIELIIVDDNSTDNSAELIRNWLKENPTIKYQFIEHKENKSICFSHNEMLALTQGKYISLIATDDVYEPDKIEKQVKLFENLPEEYGVVYGDMYVIDEQGNLTQSSFYKWYLNGSPVPQGNVIESYFYINPVHVLGALIKKNVFDKTGPYDESLYFEDWDMGFRWARVCKFYYHADIVSSYRKFTGQMTDSYMRNPQKYLRVLETNFKMFLKHLDLEDPYRAKIIQKLKATHYEMVQNSFFTTSDNFKISKQLLNVQPSFYNCVLYFFSLINKPKLFFKLKSRLSHLVALIKK